uniref:CBS domain-containing protein n=1 Tax=Meloidogyne incognita TaxID=6306 RepID=A0A914MXL7_MELIC
MTTTEHQHFNIVHNNNVQTSTPTTTRTIQQQTYNGVNSSLNHHYNGQQRHKHPRTPVPLPCPPAAAFLPYYSNSYFSSPQPVPPPPHSLRPGILGIACNNNSSSPPYQHQNSSNVEEEIPVPEGLLDFADLELNCTKDCSNNELVMEPIWEQRERPFQITQGCASILPNPKETPANIIPPEMEETSQSWRQYAVASLTGHRLSVTSQPRRKISKISTSAIDGKNGSNETEEVNVLDDDNDDGEDFEEEEGGFRERCTTVTYRFPTTNNNNNNSEEKDFCSKRRIVAVRKLSMGHQRQSGDERKFASSLSPDKARAGHRRLSIPERSLLNANYAILRKSIDRFEVVGSFHSCHSEAYRNFLQSLSCYDLSSVHTMIVMMDSELQIQKAVQLLSSHMAPRFAVIANARVDGQWAPFTVTDCLLALSQAHRKLDGQLGEQTLRFFIEQIQNGRRLISVDDQTCAWDLARVFALNRVHRVPVFNVESFELVGVLSPRQITQELLKLVSSGCSLSPDLKSITLGSRLIGIWGGPESIATIKEGQSCAQAIDLFLEKQVSSLPVLSSNDGSLLGVLDKNGLLDRLFEHLGSHQTPERCFRLMEETPVEDLLSQTRRRTVSPNCSVFDAMRILTEVSKYVFNMYLSKYVPS